MKIAPNPTTQAFVTKLIEATSRFWSVQRSEGTDVRNPVSKTAISTLFGVAQTQTTRRPRTGTSNTRAALSAVQLAARKLAARVLSPSYSFSPA